MYDSTVTVITLFSQMFESIPQLMAGVTAKRKIPVIKQVQTGLVPRPPLYSVASRSRTNWGPGGEASTNYSNCTHLQLLALYVLQSVNVKDK